MKFLRKARLASTLEIPADHAFFAKTLSFYDRLGSRLRAQEQLRTVFFGFFGLSAISAVGMLNLGGSLADVGSWMAASVIFSIAASFVVADMPFAAKAPLFIFGTACSFVGITLLGNLRPVIATEGDIAMKWNGIGFAASMFPPFFMTLAMSAHRQACTAPSVDRLRYLRKVYLPLFEGDTSPVKAMATISLFTPIAEEIDLPRAGRYMLASDEVLFSSVWTLSETSELKVRHEHVAGAVFKRRKNKSKGSRHEDCLKLVLSGAGGVDPTLARNFFEAALRKKSRQSVAYRLSVDGGKIKLSMKLSKKLPSEEAAFSDTVIAGEVVQGAITALSELHMKLIASPSSKRA